MSIRMIDGRGGWSARRWEDDTLAGMRTGGPEQGAVPEHLKPRGPEPVKKQHPPKPLHRYFLKPKQRPHGK